MQIILDAIAVILGAYLAFTNHLADKIEPWFTAEEKPIVIENNQQTDTQTHSSLLNLPKNDTDTIPDILLQNKKYQQANVIDSDINRTTKDALSALVNIYCTFTTDTTIRTTTGTGFFVHSKGVILTNAHVAQYLLLKESGVLGKSECLIRNGNPASAKYKAELLYIPPAWIQKNASDIDSTTPTGTGERDYALLYVTDSAISQPLPDHFPALAINSELMPKTIKGQQVQALGYPAAEFLKKGGNTSLIPESTFTSISELYTFGSNYADVFSVRGSKIGVEGSSGGPIINDKGQAIGIIVTKGNDSVDGKGSLRAITMSHVHRTILEETGFSLKHNLAGDIAKRSKIFTQTMSPFLVKILSHEINN